MTMAWFDTAVPQIQALSGVDEVCVADDSGAYVAGSNNESPDELAATLTYIGQAGASIRDAMSFDSFSHVLLSGRKDKMLVYTLNEHYIGCRLSSSASASKLEAQLGQILEAHTPDA